MKVCRGVYLSMNFFHLSNTLGSAYMGSISAGQICKYFKLGTICVDLGFFWSSVALSRHYWKTKRKQSLNSTLGLRSILI